MKTTIILISILGMACAFSMKNLYRRVKLQDSEENGVFKYWPRYSLYKHAYFYPPLKRFPVQSSSDSSEENGDGDSSEEEEGEEEETSNEEEENEESSENEDEESENSTLSFTTPAYGAEITLGTESIGLSAIQLPKKAGETGNQGPKKKESDEEEEEEEENEEAEVDENKQGVNGTSTNSTEVDSGNGNSGGDNGEEEGEEEGATVANTPGTTVAAEQDNGGFETIASPDGGFEITTPAQDAHRTTTVSFGGTTTAGFEEYEQTGTSEYDNAYEVYESENGEPRGDTYRAYEDEYSYYKGQSYDGYGGQDYFYHR
ncbi:bone sialoprotein 2 [Erinaceus europaeus]|uniref:Integrin-binding sialoprotein n=1 Tax=Erinaceus europaeus TaxID=9365 RepID=A0ABM3X709_ERIEU|nr:bone sialoprotein 2 [Erinaceus europaeus]